MTNIIYKAASRHFLSAFCIFSLLFVFTNAEAQNTDVPHTINYQGQVKAADGSAITGMHRLTVTFYSDWNGKNSVWQGKYSAEITNGIFNIALGSGASKLPEVSVMNRPLWVGVAVDDGAEMKPLTQLTGVPYAMNVPDKSITAAKLADDVLLSINNSSGSTPTAQGLPNWSRTGDPYSRTNIPPDVLGTNAAGGDLEIQTQGTHAVRYEMTASTPNITGGYSGNLIYLGNPGSVISGGGESGFENRDTSQFTFIGGGKSNYIGFGSPFAVIAGGMTNHIKAYDSGAFIGGGQGNIIGDGDADGDDIYSLIVGGYGNYIKEGLSAIVGGHGNFIYNYHCFLGGGDSNAIGSDYSVICGGMSNFTTITSGSSVYSFIGSGLRNGIINSTFSALPGGDSNTITQGNYSFLGAGHKNVIEQLYGALAGGESNMIDLLSTYSFLGSGAKNITRTPYAALAGGDTNIIDYNRNNSSVYLDSVHTPGHSFIGGGSGNKLNSSWSAIAGGDHNLIADTKTAADRAFIGGGATNIVKSANSSIVGGENNLVDSGTHHAIIGGGKNNLIDSIAAYSLIGGGENNTIRNVADHALLGGGKNNLIDTGSAYAVIAGGKNNTIQTHSYIYYGITYPPIVSYSVVGGGLFNQALAPYNVIAGGDSNIIGYDQWNSSYSFIGGGQLDTIDPGSPNNVVCGGWKNHNGGGWSLMGAGARNYIYDNSICDLIGAGRDNFIGNQTHTPGGKGISFSSIVSGDTNKVSAGWSGILDGKFNLIANDAEYSILGGGFRNTIDTGSIYSTLGGGYKNIIGPNTIYSFLGGGDSNRIFGQYGSLSGGSQNEIRLSIFGHASSNYCTITGGLGNFVDQLFPYSGDTASYVLPSYVTVAGGRQNCVYGHYATVSGGWMNRAEGAYSTIVGGEFLSVEDYQTAVGRVNLTSYHGFGWRNTNNWGSPENDPSHQTRPPGDYWTFMVGNGNEDLSSHGIPGVSNAFMVADTGYTMVTVSNGNSCNSDGTPLLSGRAMRLGATFVDNVISASGDIEPTNIAPNKVAVLYSFGVHDVVQIFPGVFIITLMIIDPISNNQAHLRSGASITASLVNNDADSASSAGCGSITVSRINTPVLDQFVVRTYAGGISGCSESPREFMFKVVGRP